MIISINELISLLLISKNGLSKRVEMIKKYRELVFNEIDNIKEDYFNKEEIWSTLVNLAYDLEFYEADKRIRAEDPSFYGNERFEKEIKEALKKLEQLGVSIENNNK